MYNYHRKKKPVPLFLNVKPVMPVMPVNVLRKYSSGLDHLNYDLSGRVDSSKSYASNDSTNQHFIPSIFYRNIAPVQWFLRLIGVMPFTRPKPGRTQFRMSSLAFGYAVLIFIFVACYAAFVANNRIQIVASLSGPFEEAVIAYLFLVNIFPIFLIPILWWETRKVAQLINDWDDFEILYYQISGQSIPLRLRRKSTVITIILPLLSIISVIITHVTMADFKLEQIIPYCILDNFTAMLGAWWFLICESLSDTANILADRFQGVGFVEIQSYMLLYFYIATVHIGTFPDIKAKKYALRHIGPAAMVADYRALWLRLSKLTRDTGTATCYTFTFLNLYLFFIITLSIYGLMSQISEGFGIKDIGLAITALWNIGLLFFICDEAHYASFNVRTNFQKKLLMVELNWMNSDAQTEINMFLRATEMNPSNINCGGFFDMNRNLFKGLLTTMVTYLVVLLQFQISIPTDPKVRASNVTMTDMENSDIVMDSLDNDMTLLMNPTATTTMMSTLNAAKG